MNQGRKIIHIDMDCFYAAIEERDHPTLTGKPLAVGGKPNARGVICTCNYVARKFGIHSAMATSQALKLCPQLIVLPPNMTHYANISQQIKMIFNAYSPYVEPLSLDEAFLDVTDTKQFGGSATLIAKAIRQTIWDRHALTASAGIASNKLLAKIASDWHKPNGMFAIRPDDISAFMKTLPIEKLFGVGKVTAAKLHDMKITTCTDLQKLSRIELSRTFGSFGAKLYELARGQDDRPVESKRERKSVSVEQTFVQDIHAWHECVAQLKRLFVRLQNRLQKHHHRIICKQFVKIKTHDFISMTKECVSMAMSLVTFETLLREVLRRQNKPIRLLGIGVRFEREGRGQQESFAEF